MKISSLTASLLAVALAATVAPAMAQNAAVVNGKAIPSAKVDALIKKSGQPESPELRNRAREMLIDRELLEQDALKRGLLEREDVQEQLTQARLNVLVAAEFEDYVKNSPATEEELRKQYDKIKTQFGNGKEYHAHHILVEKEADAKAIIAKLKAGAKFEDIAKAQSKDKGSGANGGDLDWANPGTYVPEFSAALTALKKGEITQTPVKTQFGWHVIRLDDTRDAKIPSFEEVKPQLLEMMMGDQNWQRTKFQAMLKDLREKAKIQ
ncbi:peptidylprolyl isomerase [Ralstonia mannitolilytica]|uniref:peptidylprolyl isomerase n=1 Tax=Ralstonia mannitolilytica TaxID=105219 RepID=A0AAD2AKS0_9RALS|nr:peptidylprolyl isomerase [Ralstonia mannitolilytica]ATG19854.1 peptidylprolyl isomerase [Ralstonia pickettii]MBY4719471.1 peptidylprolyl isomerase [Ralstonia mannitolilytica]CAJ0679360.1 putative parvulin-type peptidyl-prolyl cis-trans isomerase [Ralstonia mannitolilytica]CAJ0696701.1 putative parvulin-type peptidyl-prolyl cis-trans isomerase [Ralstonia mannitolilytica]CAJ0714336.1 putative parvulin-type peptidyl-prolyl cis-trans isomerase [Ralstonia mannitolilytica]